MEMTGGGFFKIGPGQITDDGELMMSLMWGIIKGNEKSKKRKRDEEDKNTEE